MYQDERQNDDPGVTEKAAERRGRNLESDAILEDSRRIDHLQDISSRDLLELVRASHEDESEEVEDQRDG